MNTDLIKFAQEGLVDHGYDGKIDGFIGSKTVAALNRVHFVQDPNWGVERRAIAFAQFLLNRDGTDELLKVDGLVTPATTAALKGHSKSKPAAKHAAKPAAKVSHKSD